MSSESTTDASNTLKCARLERRQTLEKPCVVTSLTSAITEPGQQSPDSENTKTAERPETQRPRGTGASVDRSGYGFSAAYLGAVQVSELLRVLAIGEGELETATRLHELDGERPRPLPHDSGNQQDCDDKTNGQVEGES